MDEESHSDVSHTLQASRDFRIISRLSKMLEAPLELLDDPGRGSVKKSRAFEKWLALGLRHWQPE